jgi:hypothetical protein
LGLLPIADVRPGDLVLSQDVESGELRHQPVLATTVRPAGEMRKLRIRDEQITTTISHPFWVIGKGWSIARELDAGVSVHALRQPLTIDAIEECTEASVYNLIVPGTNTYFVGEAGVLVHDFTLCRPTDAVLPGLKATD